MNETATPPELLIGGVAVPAGSRQTVNLPVADLYTRTPIHLPVIVHRGVKPGPTLFVSAAMHGDEIIELQRRSATLHANRIAVAVVLPGF